MGVAPNEVKNKSWDKSYGECPTSRVSFGLTQDQLKLNLHLMPPAKTISMLDLRAHAKKIVGQVLAGQSIVLTYRGRPALRLEPILPQTVEADDPFYRLTDLSKRRGPSLTNQEIDDIVYGH
jgi:antitoxin (DNA-binding transcriptional repressor) of toxin-antitoxin stability system